MAWGPTQEAQSSTQNPHNSVPARDPCPGWILSGLVCFFVDNILALTFSRSWARAWAFQIGTETRRFFLCIAHNNNLSVIVVPTGMVTGERFMGVAGTADGMAAVS